VASSVLLLCTFVLLAIGSQNSVFAQNSNSTTPDLLFFSDAIFPNSIPTTDNVGDRSDVSEGGNDTQGMTEAEDETTTASEAEDETTTASEKEIEVTKKKVNEELFEDGIFGLGF
jgi:hypothetical protein